MLVLVIQNEFINETIILVNEKKMSEGRLKVSS